MVDGVPTGIGGDGIMGIRYQCHLCRSDFSNQGDKLWCGIAFDIEFSKTFACRSNTSL